MNPSIQFRISPLQIPMKVGFKHASAERTVSESIWVEASRGALTGLGEGCPRVYVTGEQLPTAIEWAEQIVSQLGSIESLEQLQSFVEKHSDAIDSNPSAWCAIELALLDLLSKEQSVSIENLLGVSEDKVSFQYSAVLSADEELKFQKTLEKYMRFGFSDFKLKAVASLEEDIKRIETIKSYVEPRMKLLWPPVRVAASLYAARSPFEYRLRIDGNNAWAGREAEIDPLLEQSPIKIWAIEEPYAARDFQALSQLSLRKDVGIILDESLCNVSDFKAANRLPGRWIGNLRVSKLGGLLRSLDVVRKLKTAGWQVIVGAQVGETSVLSRAALVVAQEAGISLTAQEGAFGTLLLERDQVSPEIKFGLAGVLKHRKGDQGLGLSLSQK